MLSFWALIKRNTKVYFKDKGVFFTSLITPLILLCLFVTFMRNVYIDSIKTAIPAELNIPNSLFEGFAGGWLISSLLAVSCITVAFCANMIMVSDKVNGSIKDIQMTPVKSHILNLSYYVSTVFVTCIVCYTAFAIGLIYLAFVGFYLTFSSIMLAILDVFLLVMFGTALSSIVCRFLNSQGGISAVGTLVSSVYGFICGAYMPMSQFGDTLQKVLMFLPGTYGTGLIRNHMMTDTLNKLESYGVNEQITAELSKSFDATMSFFGHDIGPSTMYAVLGITVVVLVGIFLLISLPIKKKKTKN